ncbi:venom allergen 2 [Monomorium pharaonis]|uniref:venom allergen 2 n=1 Tax=Monomorium pharaonis TaxID=307658 RepID=UPI00063ED6AA|nr:venom allergen 2 [Monomorium pharaonis]
MKAFIVATCLLTTVVNTFDLKEVLQIYSNLDKCAKVLPKCGNEPKDLLIRPDVWHCELSKRNIIDKNGVQIKERNVELCDIFITNPYNLIYCKKTVSGCIDKANQGLESVYEKSRAAIECIIKSGVTSFIEFPK